MCFSFSLPLQKECYYYTLRFFFFLLYSFTILSFCAFVLSLFLASCSGFACVSEWPTGCHHVLLPATSTPGQHATSARAPAWHQVSMPRQRALSPAPTFSFFHISVCLLGFAQTGRAETDKKTRYRNRRHRRKR